MSHLHDFPAPAKINLSLRITKRRPDGFHELETLMCPLTLADRLEVDASAMHREARDLKVELTCSEPDLPLGRENLVVAAAHAFAGAHGFGGHLRVHLEKQIPHGAGLGGGSSDAATMLLALRKLLMPELAVESLHSLAVALGSDVAVFLLGRAAHCRGRGEIFVEGPLPAPSSVLLLKPEFAVSTPWAYKAYAAMREAGTLPDQVPDAAGLINDLEAPVFQKYLVLPVAKQWLSAQHGVRGALMSGSGSTMFALLDEETDTHDLRERFHAEFGQAWWSWLGSTAPAAS